MQESMNTVRFFLKLLVNKKPSHLSLRATIGSAAIYTATAHTVWTASLFARG